MTRMLEPLGQLGTPTWLRSDHDGTTYQNVNIVASDEQDIEVMPRVCVEVSIGTGQTLRLTTEEARRWARVLVEAADRVDAGEGFAR